MENHKVFNNPLILDCIFGFSKYAEIKNFRQVCRQWNSVATPILKKLSLISFRKPSYTLPRFNRLFQNSQLGTDFNAIKLSKNSYYDLGWKLSEFAELLEDRKLSTTELTISRIQLDYEATRNRFDLSPYIEPNLTKLDVTASCVMNISTDCCKLLKSISLTGCHLKIANGVKINPEELTLDNVMINLNGNPEASSLNGFVNFDRLKSLSLVSVRYSEDNIRDINLSLHFRDPVTVERVNLCGLELDFNNAKWKIKEKFSLRETDFVKPNGMEFFNFEIHGGALRLDVLPKNLKKLKIADRVTQVSCSQPINLPELAVLLIWLPRYQNSREFQTRCISHFNGCQNLTTIMLTINRRDIDPVYIVNIDTFPKSVRKLYLCGKIEFIGNDENFQLKQLLIKWSRLQSVYSVLRRFKGEQLAVDLRYPPNYDSLLETIKDISLRPFDSIAVAYDELQENNYSTSPLAEVTNELSGFYIFTNGFGTSIPKARFEERTPYLFPNIWPTRE